MVLEGITTEDIDFLGPSRSEGDGCGFRRRRAALEIAITFLQPLDWTSITRDPDTENLVGLGVSGSCR